MRLIRLFFSLCLSLALLSNLWAQRELTLLGHKAYPFDLNDIWGYTDPEGAEYALVGTVLGVSIVALDQPGLPEVAFVPGTQTPWRDLKTFGDHAYVTADGRVDDGLLVIDLSGLPDTVTSYNWRPLIQGNPLGPCHNLYIEADGTAYLAGCSGINNGGLIALDVSEPATEPRIIGFGAPIYAHDVYALGGRLYTAELFQGNLGIYDGTDPARITPLASTPTPFLFTHNAWASPDNRFVFVTDERANAVTAAYDVSDLTDVRQVGEYRPAGSRGTGVIPHNVHVFRDWLVLSHYTEGLRIVDATRPSNLVETAYYDTSDTTAVGFFGAWGAFPFLPSGRILVTDIENGLFVLQPHYGRATYLEGTVLNAEGGGAVAGASIRIDSPQPNAAETDPFGQYRSGLADAGTYAVTISHPAFLPVTETVTLTEGAVTTLEVALQPKPRYPVSGTVRFQGSQDPVPNLDIELSNQDFSYRPETVEQGQFELQEVIAGDYWLRVFAWGGLAPEPLPTRVEQPRALSLSMEAGYEDDFHLDWDWRQGGDAVRGGWVRGRPDGVRLEDTLVTPGADSPIDIGPLAFLTAPLGGQAGDHDVDSGRVWLRSPVLELSRIQEPLLSFDYWFYNSFGGTDTFQVYLSNDRDSVLLFEVTESASVWRRAENLALQGLFPPSEPLYLTFVTGDQPDSDDIVEAAIDDLVLRSGEATPLASPGGEPSLRWLVFPNPFRQRAEISYRLPERLASRGLEWRAFGPDGRLVERAALDGSREGRISLGAHWPPGWYVLSLHDASGAVLAHRKLIKAGN